MGWIKRCKSRSRAGKNRLRCLSQLCQANRDHRRKKRIVIQTRRALPAARRENSAGFVPSIESEHANRQADASHVSRDIQAGGKICRSEKLKRPRSRTTAPTLGSKSISSPA